MWQPLCRSEACWFPRGRNTMACYVSSEGLGSCHRWEISLAPLPLFSHLVYSGCSVRACWTESPAPPGGYAGGGVSLGYHHSLTAAWLIKPSPWSLFWGCPYLATCSTKRDTTLGLRGGSAQQLVWLREQGPPESSRLKAWFCFLPPVST